MNMNTTKSTNIKQPIYKKTFLMWLFLPVLAFGFFMAIATLFNVVGIKSGKFAVFIGYYNILAFIFLPSYLIAVTIYLTAFRKRGYAFASSQIFIPVVSAIFSFLPSAFVSADITRLLIERNSAIITILVTIFFVSLLSISGYIAIFNIIKYIGKPLYEKYCKKTSSV